MNLVSRMNKVAREMSTIDRYSQTRLINPESVLEHTGFVAFCSLMIAHEMIDLGVEGIDIESVLTKAIIHDVEETITGDISCPTKYWNPEITKQIQKVEYQAAETVCGELSHNRDSGEAERFLFTMWRESKQGQDGLIVALADKLAVVYKVQQETLSFGNQTLKNHVQGLVPSLTALDIKYLEEEHDGAEFYHEIIMEAIEICHSLI